MEERLTRRSVLGAFGAFGAAVLAGCGSALMETSPEDGGAGGSGGNEGGAGGETSSGGATSAAGAGSGGTSAAGCQVVPEETAGPYPDKIGMLQNATYFRRDITEGKKGLPLTLTLTVLDTSASCEALAGADVEIWHCDAEGEYSEYAQPGYDGTGETFLRGSQTTDANGQVTFTTIYPGWYQGRVTHIHFQVYVAGKLVKTSQIAFSDATTSAIYATGEYAAHGQNSMTNATDMVFSDGDEHQLATLTGDTTSGVAATLSVGVAS